ncbi:MAG: hypothetical protein AB7G06_02025 [Bdellovibrionales bacterium]
MISSMPPAKQFLVNLFALLESEEQAPRLTLAGERDCFLELDLSNGTTCRVSAVMTTKRGRPFLLTRCTLNAPLSQPAMTLGFLPHVEDKRYGEGGILALAEETSTGTFSAPLQKLRATMLKTAETIFIPGGKV